MISIGHGTTNYDKQFALTKYLKSNHREYLQRAWLMTGIAIIDLPALLWRLSLGEVVLGTVIAEREHRRDSSIPQPFSCCAKFEIRFQKVQRTDFCIRCNLKDLSRITAYCMNPLLAQYLVIRDSFLYPSLCKKFWNTAMIIARHNELKKIRMFALTWRSPSLIERSDYWGLPT